MTFNQWCVGKHLGGDLRFALEAIWNELAFNEADGNGLSPAKVERLMNDLMDGIKEQYDAEPYSYHGQGVRPPDGHRPD